MDIKQLVEKWSAVPGKMSIASIEDGDIQKNMATLLQNIDEGAGQPGQLFAEASTAGNTIGTATVDDTSKGAFAPMTLALMRRTFPGLFANKVVGVQAMTGPVGLAYALRVLYNTTALPRVEAAFENVDDYSGFTGSDAGTSGTADTGTAVDTATAEGWELTNSGAYPQLKVRLDQTAITAKSRKLGASFSLEAIQDIAAMHKIDIQREIVNYLQYEIQAELDRELLYKLKTVAVDTANGGETATSYDLTSSAADGRWSQEKFSNIITQIVKKANDIATATRRGAGNFVIVSNRVATALQAAGPQFARNVATVNATNTLEEVGTINGTITVYRDSYATTDYALVGYKGPGIQDTGVIYSPYVTGLVSTTVNQEDFAPKIGVMSRYAITDSLLGSGRYYRLINFSNLDAIIA